MPTPQQTIRIVGPSEFDSGTAQTPGSVRRAAITLQLGIDTVLWGGVFETEPGASMGTHHHGKQETIAYVLSGSCEVRWGSKGKQAAAAKAGDFIHVPANPSDTEPFRWIVVRSTPVPIVVNLPGDTWPCRAR